MKEKNLSRCYVVAIFILSLIITNATGQFIRKIPHISSVGYITAYGSGLPIIYKDKLYFNYSNTRMITVNLGEFDGQNLKFIFGPGQNANLESPLLFNNKLYYIYQGGWTIDHNRELFEYDGERVTLYPNPTPKIFLSEPLVIYHSKIYAYNRDIFDTAKAQQSLCMFDGTQVSIDTVVNKNGSYYFANILTTFGDQLVFADNGKLAAFNGLTTTRYDNPEGFDRLLQASSGNYISFANELYVDYTKINSSIANLAKFDGMKVVIVPNRKNTDSYRGHPFVFKDQLYFRYSSLNYNTEQLARYNGDSIQVVPSPDDGQFSNLNYTQTSYRDGLYILYKNASGVNFLARADGDSIKLIPNPDGGMGFNGKLFVFGDKIFSSYITSDGTNKIITYNGSNFEFIPSESGSNLIFEGPIVYANKLYFISAGDLVYLDNTALPLSFTQFTGKQKNNAAVLNWQTGSERNTNRFIIQRSNDGINFFDIGKINASGNSNSTLNYSFIDNALTKPGSSKLFYRLNQVDNDGKSQFSDVIVLTIETSDGFAVYPSPAHDLLNIDLPQPLTKTARIILYDMNGKTVAQKPIVSSDLHQQIYTSSIKSGSYNVVVVEDNKQVLSSHITILH